MTESKTMRRRRRVQIAGPDNVPAEVLAWFGQGCPVENNSIPWPVLLEPATMVHGWWQAWIRLHPRAIPAGAGYLLEATR